MDAKKVAKGYQFTGLITTAVATFLLAIVAILSAEIKETRNAEGHINRSYSINAESAKNWSSIFVLMMGAVGGTGITSVLNYLVPDKQLEDVGDKLLQKNKSKFTED